MHLIHLTYKHCGLASPTLYMLRTQYPKFTGSTLHCRKPAADSRDLLDDGKLGLAGSCPASGESILPLA